VSPSESPSQSPSNSPSTSPSTSPSRPPSIAPSQIPSASPSFSPAPYYVRIQLDYFASDFSILIRDLRTNSVVLSKPPRSYRINGAFVTETVILQPGRLYLLELRDSFGDGLSCSPTECVSNPGRPGAVCQFSDGWPGGYVKIENTYVGVGGCEYLSFYSTTFVV
jgi:hypothetical protein